MRSKPRREKHIQIHEPAGPARGAVAPPPRTRQSPSARNPCSSCALALSEGSAAPGVAAARITLVTDVEKEDLAIAGDTFELGCGFDFAGDETKRGIFEGFGGGLLSTAAA